MNRFEQTSIWQKTLGKQFELDAYEKSREFLRIEFENFRERAKVLAAEIAHILPEFTVHDITHIDALWETAELVVKDNLNLSPAEAFVLGGSFLIHDLGMGLAAFPKGVEELKKEPIWKDTVTSLLKEKTDRPIKDGDFLNLDSNIERIALENVLRLLHAKHAEKLALVSWKDENGKDVFLIENTELRNAYGNVIGLISHSHWWKADELEDKLPKVLGAPGIFPSSWIIDPVRLACILRIADATQIDDRRAPSFLRTIRKPSNYSDLHWNFQQKLYQPRLERSRLVFTSKSSFGIDEIDSWWLCYDTLRMIDNELNSVDSLLLDSNRTRLNAIGVASIEEPYRLSRLISVDGWQPVDAKIKVTNVARLVGSLGGKQLYGDSSVVPLRELIQNSSDAIRARRILENETSDFGNILIRVGKDKHGHFIEVEDNGIGMSKKVLIGPFLDFGESFWGTALMHEELPGLESKGFSSTGKYGIGFFSVFMLGNKVSVYSKRFETGRDNTLVLEFNNGVSSRPILRAAAESEVIKDGGTRIRVWFSTQANLDNLLRAYGKSNKNTMEELIGNLCPSIDCNIIIEDKGKLINIIKANDWITIPAINLLKRLMGKSYYENLNKGEKKLLANIAKNMSLIKEDDGTIVGRLLLYKEERKRDERFPFEGQVTVGGFRTSGLTGLLGVLVGSSARASRDVGIPIISNKALKDWATNQAMKLSKFILSSETEIECSAVVRRCQGSIGKLKMAYHKTGILNYQQIKGIIKNTDCESFFVAHDAAVYLFERDNDVKIEFLDNVFWVSMGVPGILQTRDTDSGIIWPITEENFENIFLSTSLEGLITEAFADAWGSGIDEILKCCYRSSDHRNKSGTIGIADGKPVKLDYLDIINKPFKK